MTKTQVIVPESALVRILLGTKYVSFIGKRIVKSYVASVNADMRLVLKTRGGDLSVAREVLESRDYERHFSPQLGQTVVDIGAHIGCFTVRAAKAVGPEGRVLAFEPSSENFTSLRKNIEINGLGNVEAFRVALSDEECELADFYIYKTRGSNSMFKREGKVIESTEKITVKTLDGMVGRANLSRVDIIKIDAEGSELQILKGGERTIRRFHPKITGEAHPAFSDSSQSLLDYLSKLGYIGKVEENAGRHELFNAT